MVDRSSRRRVRGEQVPPSSMEVPKAGFRFEPCLYPTFRGARADAETIVFTNEQEWNGKPLVTLPIRRR